VSPRAQDATTVCGDARRVHRRTPLIVLERLVWLLAVVSAVLVLGAGLERNIYFENTSDALREAAVGVQMIWGSSVALVVLIGYAWWRGAPAWCWGPVLSAPLVCGGLMALWSESLFPELAFLVVGPLAGLGALVGVAVRWRPAGSTCPAARPAR
jgi:hypothetical protein